MNSCSVDESTYCTPFSCLAFADFHISDVGGSVMDLGRTAFPPAGGLGEGVGKEDLVRERQDKDPHE
jgi:hypothetical protein